MSQEDTKVKKLVRAADSLSIGISISVAVLIGVFIGIGIRHLSGSNWGLGIGIFIGVAAAINNIYKVYKAQIKSYEEFDPKNLQKIDDEDEI